MTDEISKQELREENRHLQWRLEQTEQENKKLRNEAVEINFDRFSKAEMWRITADALASELEYYQDTTGVDTLEDILKDWLEKHEYDGLYNEVAECGCIISDLCPCSHPNEIDCEPGVILRYNENGDWVIGPPGMKEDNHEQ